MRAWANIARRFAAGLALLAMLTLSLSQALASPRITMPCCEDVPQSAMSLTGQAEHHESGSPLSHSKAHTDCCLAGDCSIVAPVVTPASLMIPAGPPAAAYRDATPATPEGLGTHPAIPPPRTAI